MTTAQPTRPAAHFPVAQACDARGTSPHDSSNERQPRPRGPAVTRAIAFTAALVGALAGCGGGGSDSGTPFAAIPASSAPASPALAGGGSPDAPSADDGSSTTPTPRTLVIDLDGATYSAVQSGIAAGKLPNLAQLSVRLAYSGGIAGTPGQQPTLDTPGWATLLTGSWASRHQVLSDAPRQAPHAGTVFQIARAANTGMNGAAVASGGLAQLLTSDHDSGSLDALSDCSRDASATDCVTVQAAQFIASDYGTVLAQYHAAKDAALDFGLGSTQYTGVLATLDKAVGALVAAAAKRRNSRWLVVVTGNHGLSANSQDDGLPLVPESSTFIGLNQAANIATKGVGAAVPAKLGDLYAYASIADIAPTVLGYLNALPGAKNYAMDGAQLVGAQPVSQLSASVGNNNSADANVQLTW